MRLRKWFSSSLFFSYQKKGIYIEYKNSRLEVDFSKDIGLKRFFLDEEKILKIRPSKREPIVRAITTKRFKPRLVMDLTAGFGLDTIQIALLDIPVICCEKEPVIFLFLKEFISRLGVFNLRVATRIRPIFGNSINILKEVGSSIPIPDLIYLDPMFPDTTKKKGKEKKYMQVIKLLKMEIEDESLLFQRAMECTSKRVVIKRPLYAEEVKIMGKGPLYQVQGRGHRFDVYVK